MSSLYYEDNFGRVLETIENWISFKILEGKAWFHIDMNLSNLLDTSGNYIEKKVVVYA